MPLTESEIKKIIQEEILAENFIKDLYNKFFNRPEKISAEDIIVSDESGQVNSDATEETRKAFNKINFLIKQGMPKDEAFRQIISQELEDIKRLSGLRMSVNTGETSKNVQDYQSSGRSKEIAQRRKKAREIRNQERKNKFDLSKIAQRAMKEIPTELGAEDLEYVKENKNMKLTNDIIRQIILEELKKAHKKSSNVDEGILGGLKGVAAGPVQAYKVGSLKQDVQKFANKYRSSLASITKAVEDFENRAKSIKVELSPELQNAKKFALTSAEALTNISGDPEKALSGDAKKQSEEQPKKDGKPTSEEPPAVGGTIPAGGKPTGPVQAPESVASINPSSDKNQQANQTPEQTSRKAFGQEVSGEGPRPSAEAPKPAEPASTPAAAPAPTPAAAPAPTPAAAPAPTPAAPADAPVPNINVQQLIKSVFEEKDSNKNDPDIRQLTNQLNQKQALAIIDVANRSFTAEINERNNKSKKPKKTPASPQQRIATIANQAGVNPQQVKILFDFLHKKGKLPARFAQGLGYPAQPAAAQPAKPKEETAQDQNLNMGNADENKKLYGKQLKEHLISRTNNSLSNEQARRMKLLAGIIK